MNYFNTLILIADDCSTHRGIIPTVKDGRPKPIHAIQYDLISGEPYKYTQEDVLFIVYTEEIRCRKMTLNYVQSTSVKVSLVCVALR